jgi:hypothetical protein
MVPAMSYNVTLMPHPWLYAGVDDWAWALDEINGAGVNDAVWVNTFDSSDVPLVTVTFWGDNFPDVDLTIDAERQRYSIALEQSYFMLPSQVDLFAVDAQKFSFSVPSEISRLPVYVDDDEKIDVVGEKRLIKAGD